MRLTVDHLREMAEPQRSCVFWELSAVDRDRLDDSERAAAKEQWVSTVLREWGSCGRIALIDGRQVGHAIYAPAPWLPGAATLPTSPSTPDAVLLAMIHVEPRARGGGIGRLLVQGVARDLITRGVSAVEAYGDTRGRTTGCVLPAEFWGSVGFKTQRAHITTPRMRMDLRTAISWKDEVELALEKVWGVVRPPKQKAARPIGSARTAPGGRH